MTDQLDRIDAPSPDDASADGRMVGSAHPVVRPPVGEIADAVPEPATGLAERITAHLKLIG